ncbi:transglycosylase domain-containing protein [Phenylobacterium sp.]|uniref:transglycosylase domain-containing protein n=1 Tax=Phenylobacterium sp. TaxID=1871053 RepID=UPI003BAB07E4
MIPALALLERYCLKAASRLLRNHGADVPILFSALLAAEDHRGRSHRGIDWFSILRAIFKSRRTGGIKGISTIEQQLVRTVFPRRGVPRWKRKGPELRLASQLAVLLPKEVIWAAYLNCAYYGRDYPGYAYIRAKFADRTEILTELAAAQIVSCLKYPAPHWETAGWQEVHKRRTAYVLRRLAKLGPPAEWRGVAWAMAHSEP